MCFKLVYLPSTWSMSDGNWNCLRGKFSLRTNLFVSSCHSILMVDWLINWVIDWMFDRWMCGLIDWFIILSWNSVCLFTNSRHARRSSINPDDVKLLFRHSPNIGVHLDAVLRIRHDEKRKSKPLPITKAKRPTKQIPSKTPTINEEEKEEDDKDGPHEESPEVEMHDTKSKPAEEGGVDVVEFDNDFWVSFCRSKSTDLTSRVPVGKQS